MLFYLFSGCSREEIESNFYKNVKNNVQGIEKNRHLTDGRRLIWMNIKDLEKICITLDMMILNKKIYRMVWKFG